jgi:hypothetical protein
LRKASKRVCEAFGESPSAIVDHALEEFMAKVDSERREEWFGLPFSEYVALSEEEGEELWHKAYEEELDKSWSSERSVELSARTPRQRGREALRRRIREVGKKPASHS